jgi:acetyltransferase-like isoleucine patch superfamily enzyme
MSPPRERSPAYRALEAATPSLVKSLAKRAYWGARRLDNRLRFIERGRFVELGHRFRFDRHAPHVARVGERTIAEAFNVWNASYGDIVIGKACWFGLNNVLMGPVRIGDRVSTGQFVSILGPRHPSFEGASVGDRRTLIGDDVWISTGSIILFGSRIGDGAVISAGSVVAGDVPPRSILLEHRRCSLLPRDA